MKNRYGVMVCFPCRKDGDLPTPFFGTTAKCSVCVDEISTDHWFENSTKVAQTNMVGSFSLKDEIARMFRAD